MNLYRHQHEPEADGEFHEWILPGDRLSAVAATASEREPAQERNVVVPANGCAALRTAGTRVDYRFSLWDARDTDVQEAAEDKT